MVKEEIVPYVFCPVPHGGTGRPGPVLVYKGFLELIAVPSTVV